MKRSLKYLKDNWRPPEKHEMQYPLGVIEKALEIEEKDTRRKITNWFLKQEIKLCWDCKRYKKK